MTFLNHHHHCFRPQFNFKKKKKNIYIYIYIYIYIIHNNKQRTDEKQLFVRYPNFTSNTKNSMRKQK